MRLRSLARTFTGGNISIAGGLDLLPDIPEKASILGALNATLRTEYHSHNQKLLAADRPQRFCTSATNSVKLSNPYGQLHRCQIGNQHRVFRKWIMEFIDHLEHLGVNTFESATRKLTRQRRTIAAYPTFHTILDLRL